MGCLLDHNLCLEGVLMIPGMLTAILDMDFWETSFSSFEQLTNKLDPGTYQSIYTEHWVRPQKNKTHKKKQ